MNFTNPAPLTFSQSQKASEVSFFQISSIRKNYDIRKKLQDGEVVEFNGETVYELVRDGIVLDTPLLLRSAFFGDSYFYGATDILEKFEGMSAEDALKEVYYTTFSSTTDYSPLSEEFLSYLSPESLARLKPVMCSIREWENAGYKRKTELLEMYSSDSERKYLAYRYGIRITNASSAVVPNKFEPPTSRKSCEYIANYLSSSLRLEPTFIKWLIDKHLIYEDVMHNIIFPGYDESGKVRFAYIRSTWDRKGDSQNFPLDQVVPNSLEEFSWKHINPQNKVLYVFENMLDLISYMQIMKICNLKYPASNAPIMELSSFLYIGHYISGGDIPVSIEAVLNKFPRIKKVIICFDNDQDKMINYGQESAKALQQVLKKHKLHTEIIDLEEFSTFQDYLINMMKNIDVGALFPF